MGVKDPSDNVMSEAALGESSRGSSVRVVSSRAGESHRGPERREDESPVEGTYAVDAVEGRGVGPSVPSVRVFVCRVVVGTIVDVSVAVGVPSKAP